MFNRPRRPRGAAFGGPLTAAALALAMIPNAAWACACGCGVFDVGTSSMFPSGAGGMAFVEYDYMNQNRNWSGSSSAPAANNSQPCSRGGKPDAHGPRVLNQAGQNPTSSKEAAQTRIVSDGSQGDKTDGIVTYPNLVTTIHPSYTWRLKKSRSFAANRRE